MHTINYNEPFHFFQYAEHFAGCLVDARLLDHLSKKDLEKYLGVTRKFHLASIAHGVHLLRIVAYDRQVNYLNQYNFKIFLLKTFALYLMKYILILTYSP